MTIKEISEHPTVIDNNHESLYRSYEVLEKVIKLLKRGDSNETIIEVIDFVTENPNH